MRNLLFICLLAFSACSEQNNKEQETEKTVKTETTVEKTETVTKTETPAAGKAVLTLTPMDMAGDLGRITFSQKEKTVFYFDNKTKKGEIVLNNKKQVLDKYAFDSKKETYEISNSEVKIVTGPCKFKESDGSDCFYGNIKDVTITSGEGELILNGVDVQDCPSY